jgi:site-specific recombinase XerD
MTERDYREANLELIESYVRYCEARCFSPQVTRQRRAILVKMAEYIGSRSFVQVGRSDILALLEEMLQRGLGASTINKHTNGLRSFFRFLRLTDLISVDPTLQISHRKLPKRLPRVLTVKEVEAVINAAKTPLERAVAETLYGTGIRVSELCGIQLENVDFANRMIKVLGKGNRERYVLFGRKAAEAIRKYLEWRPSKAGYLFEVAKRRPTIHVKGKIWYCHFYARNGRQRGISLGKVADIPTKEAAREVWKKIAAKIPDGPHKPTADKPQHPYKTRHVQRMLKDMADRAGVKGVHPHALRRAMACHMLAGGADIRAIQELLGHRMISTTQIYTTLTNEQVDAVYRKAHPHAQSLRGLDAAKA